MKRTEVCILQNGLARGGTDTFVVNLCKRIDKSNFEIVVVNCNNQPKCIIREQDILSQGIKIEHTGDLLGLRNKLMHYWRLYKILKKGKFEFFQTNIDLQNGVQLLVAKLAGIPVRICHSHNTQQQAEIMNGRSLSLRIYQNVMRWLCWNCSTRRCGCSEEAMEFLFKGRPWRQNEYPSIIYNGIDIAHFRKRIDTEAKKSKLRLSKKKHILTVGQMVLQKNPKFIVKCISSYLEKNDDTDFVWIGVGPEKEQIDKWLVETDMTDRFHFLGSRNDVNEVMQCCDCFFLPSHFEGLGIVMIEAQAAGLSCVASTAVPLLTDCGKVEYVSLDDSYNNWHFAIDRAIENKSTINEGALQKFSIENMTQQMTQVFTVK